MGLLRTLPRLQTRLRRFAIVAAALLVVACGDRTAIAIDEPTAGFDATTDTMAACPSATPACDLANVSPPAGACAECLSATLCGCQHPNGGTWTLPTDCDYGPGLCGRELTDNHACQVGAVELMRCFAANSFESCQKAYFAEHASGIAPIGMAFGLYMCAGCACLDACSNHAQLAELCP
jgi:hypothetical protein